MGREEGNERSSVVLTTNYLLNCGRVSPNQNEITLYPQPNSHYLLELRPPLSDFSHSSPACWGIEHLGRSDLLILLNSVNNRLLLICWLDWLLLIYLLLDRMLLVDSRLLLINFLLAIVSIVLLQLHWFWLLSNGTSTSTGFHPTARHAVSSRCAVSVEVDACDGKGGGEEQAVKN
jgi:hypothetical protein